MHKSNIILTAGLILLNSCITQFIPKTTEDKEILVVEGLITDKPGMNSVILSKSMPLGIKSDAKPLSGCTVIVTDDLGNRVTFVESAAGKYIPINTYFHGEIGRSYSLHISTNIAYNNLNYESYPMEMKFVPAIDSIYYEKITMKERSDGSPSAEGCQIYLDTHDQTNQCRFYRWEYSETWEFHLPYTVPNSTCWISNNSNAINVKNTSGLQEDRVKMYPINLVSYTSDRLQVKYSILVNQFSLNEDEFLYWDKLQNVSEQVGGLYDMIPSEIPSNVYCLNDPGEKVLGYFSVSSNSSKRIFIKDRFAGILSPYTNDACIADTAFGGEAVPASAWVIISNFIPSYNVYTYTRGCADCTVRGTNIEPDFWANNK
jgi:hypothetical protein